MKYKDGQVIRMLGFTESNPKTKKLFEVRVRDNYIYYTFNDKELRFHFDSVVGRSSEVIQEP